jgi:hypothetical protein
MVKPSEKYVVLFLILAFAFAYRMLLMHQTTFPPGADIGLHNSVLHSITLSGNTDFFYNFYHMGGGLSLTFPGYHIFVAFVVSLTNMPDFLAHSFSVSIFSTITVACSFLITRKVWGVAAGLLVAFLVAVSRFDLEMLMWGGYPNVVTLMLMALAFYLFLQTERFGKLPFLASTAILSASIYLTHSLSAVIFVMIVFIMAIATLVLSKHLPEEKRIITSWLVPLALGAIVVSPFLLDAFPAYTGDNEGVVTGGFADIQEAILSTKILPLQIVLPLFLCVVFFFLFSKKYLGKYLTFPSLLFTVWVLVPMFLTQGYLIGLYTDYNRFLYFVLLPVIMLIGLGLHHIAGFFARIADMYQSSRTESAGKQNRTSKTFLQLQQRLTARNTYAVSVLAFLLIAFLFIPIFMNPAQGVAVQSFYQVMTDPGYEAIQWAKVNTETDAVFVSDALYGWWFSGFAFRQTLSAVPPQYITLSRELAPAGNATYLLDTDYVIDNGLIQVREDGGYIGRHNPVFLAKLNWSYFPYPFFNFNNDDTMIRLDDGVNQKFFTLGELGLMELKSERSVDQATVSIVKGNTLVIFTQVLTVYKNRQFINMSITIDSVAGGVSLSSLDSILHIRGQPINKTDTVGLFEEGSKVLGQLIYAEKYPEEVKIITPENPSGLEFIYNLQGASSAKIQLFASAFSVSDNETLYEGTAPSGNAFLNGLLDENVKTFLNPEEGLTEDLSIDLFDYRNALDDWQISYIVCRDSSVLKKFIGDPTFIRVFINEGVSVFKVKNVSD